MQDRQLKRQRSLRKIYSGEKQETGQTGFLERIEGEGERQSSTVSAVSLGGSACHVPSLLFHSLFILSLSSPLEVNLVRSFLFHLHAAAPSETIHKSIARTVSKTGSCTVFILPLFPPPSLIPLLVYWRETLAKTTMHHLQQIRIFMESCLRLSEKKNNCSLLIKTSSFLSIISGV